MKRFLLFLLLTMAAFGQTARYPAAIATNTDLTDLADRAQTTLNASLNASATSFTVVTGSKFAANMIVTIDSEQIKICNVVGNTVNAGHSSCPNVDGRGFAGTAAASHANGALVSDYFVSYQFKALREEIKATENALGVNLANVPQPTYPIAINKGGTGATTQPGALAAIIGASALPIANGGTGATTQPGALAAIFGGSTLSVPNGGTGAATLAGILQGNGAGTMSGIAASAETQVLGRKPNAGATPVYEFASLPSLLSSDYNFTPIALGGSLSIGANSVTLPLVPAGVNGANANYWVYISSGVGAAEVVKVTGGTAVAGGSGTLVFSCLNTHSGAWTIASVAGGIPEAIIAAGAPSKIALPAGSIPVHGPVYVPIGGYVVEGQGTTATTLAVDAAYPVADVTILGAPFVLQSGTHRGEFREFQVVYAQPDTLTYAAYIHYQPTFYGQGASYARLHHVNTNLAWVSGDFRSNGSGLYWSDSYISGYDTALKMAGNGDTNRLTGVVTFAGYGATPSQGTAYTSNAIGFSAVGSFLMVESSLSLAKTGWVIDGAGGGEFQQFANCAFDTSNGLSVSNYALIHILNSYFTPGLLSAFWLNSADSNVLVENSYFSPNGSSTIPLITATNGNLSIRNSIFNLAGVDVPLVNHTGSGNFAFAGNTLGGIDQSFTRSRLTIGNGIVSTIQGNVLSALFGAHTGTFVTFTGSNSGPAAVTGNNLIGSNGTSAWGIVGTSLLISGVIKDNVGYNPAGLSAITVTTSPFSYTAGPSPETIYITGGTVTLIKRGATTVATASPAQITVPPFGNVVVTYSAVPTMVKDIQ